MNHLKNKTWFLTIAFCALLACSALIFSGCSTIREFKDDPLGLSRAQEASSQELVDYMESKYGGEFTYVNHYQAAGLFDSATACTMRCAAYPDALIRVEKGKRDNEYVFSDGYLSARYRNQTVALAEDAAAETFGDRAKVAVRTDGMQYSPEGCNAETTFGEYIAKAKIDLTFYFDASRSVDYEEDAAAIASALASKNINGTSKVYFLDSAQYATIPIHQNLIKGEADVLSFDESVKYGGVYMDPDRTLEEIIWY